MISLRYTFYIYKTYCGDRNISFISWIQELSRKTRMALVIPRGVTTGAPTLRNIYEYSAVCCVIFAQNAPITYRFLRAVPTSVNLRFEPKRRGKTR